MYWPREKHKFYMKIPFTQLNLSSIEHVRVEYPVAEPFLEGCKELQKFGTFKLLEILRKCINHYPHCFKTIARATAYG
jgi:hypothetical protein